MNNFLNAGHDYAAAAAGLAAWRAQKDLEMATPVAKLTAKQFEAGAVLVSRGEQVFQVSKDKAGYKIAPAGNPQNKLARCTDIKQVKVFLNKF